jgi:hypothetical protein
MTFFEITGIITVILAAAMFMLVVYGILSWYQKTWVFNPLKIWCRIFHDHELIDYWHDAPFGIGGGWKEWFWVCKKCNYEFFKE